MCQSATNAAKCQTRQQGPSTRVSDEEIPNHPPKAGAQSLALNETPAYHFPSRIVEVRAVQRDTVRELKGSRTPPLSHLAYGRSSEIEAKMGLIVQGIPEEINSRDLNSRDLDVCG